MGLWDAWRARAWSKALLQASIVVMVIVEVACLFEILTGKVIIGGWLWVSPSSYAAVFISTAVLVRRRGLSHMDAFLVSLTAMISMIWMYEIFYHFGFYADWKFGEQAQNMVFADYNQHVLVDVLLASVGLVGLKYMHAGPWLIVSFGAFFAAFVVWVVIGYPQVAAPGSLYPFGTIFVRVSNPDFWAYPLNALTKYLLALAYISLFLGKRNSSSV
jgi:hypothetical protein